MDFACLPPYARRRQEGKDRPFMGTTNRYGMIIFLTLFVPAAGQAGDRLAYILNPKTGVEQPAIHQNGQNGQNGQDEENDRNGQSEQNGFEADEPEPVLSEAESPAEHQAGPAGRLPEGKIRKQDDSLSRQPRTPWSRQEPLSDIDLLKREKDNLRSEIEYLKASSLQKIEQLEETLNGIMIVAVAGIVLCCGLIIFFLALRRKKAGEPDGDSS